MSDEQESGGKRKKKADEDEPLDFQALAREFGDEQVPAAEPEEEPAEAEAGDTAEAPKQKLPDENRPILTGSAYQGPSLGAHIAAFAFFAIVGIVLITTSPQIRDVMWPEELMGPEYRDDFHAPPVQEQNRIRDTRNVSLLDILYHVPFFVLTWGIVLAYFGSIVLVILRFFPFIGDWIRGKLGI